MRSVDTIIVGPGPLSFADVVAVARHGAPVELSADAEDEITASRKVIEALADDDEPHYGVSTGLRRARDQAHPGRAAAPSCSAA